MVSSLVGPTGQRYTKYSTQLQRYLSVFTKFNMNELRLTDLTLNFGTKPRDRPVHVFRRATHPPSPPRGFVEFKLTCVYCVPV